MIEELRIRDLGVIGDATLALGPGFTAITGETGAGKTMVVSALGLLMGGRSDAGAVRSGAPQARVSGLVRTEDPQVNDLVDDVGGAVEEGELALTRTVSSEGRSRASVGGAAAPVGALGRLAERLFAVHGQSEQLRLRSRSAQRETLDRFGGAEVAEALAAYRKLHEERAALAVELSELRDAHDARAAEAVRLREDLDEIAALDPQLGEDEELRIRIERLSNLEALRAASSAAARAVAGDGDDPYERDAAGLVTEAQQELERVAAHDERLAAVLEILRGIGFQLADAARELGGYLSDLDQDGPGELEQANERFSALGAVIRRFGGGLPEVLEIAETGALRLAELDGDDERVQELESRLAGLVADERAAADRLSELRRAAALDLGDRVSAELKHLALPDAEFSALVEPGELGASGADEITFLLRSHPGAEPRPLAKGASGGELSRIMLALEVVVAATDPVPTFVFDEVDVGVGGAAAIEIGRRLARLARTSQVIVVTHLAQVAAFANNHLQVVKDSSGGFTESSCRRLDGDERLGEMARLLSGLSDSSSALEHASELLQLGRDA